MDTMQVPLPQTQEAANNSRAQQQQQKIQSLEDSLLSYQKQETRWYADQEKLVLAHGEVQRLRDENARYRDQLRDTQDKVFEQRTTLENWASEHQGDITQRDSDIRELKARLSKSEAENEQLKADLDQEKSAHMACQSASNKYQQDLQSARWESEFDKSRKETLLEIDIPNHLKQIEELKGELENEKAAHTQCKEMLNKAKKDLENRMPQEAFETTKQSPVPAPPSENPGPSTSKTDTNPLRDRSSRPEPAVEPSLNLFQRREQRKISALEKMIANPEVCSVRRKGGA